jgi:hypothetical protein
MVNGPKARSSLSVFFRVFRGYLSCKDHGTHRMHGKKHASFRVFPGTPRSSFSQGPRKSRSSLSVFFRAFRGYLSCKDHRMHGKKHPSWLFLRLLRGRLSRKDHGRHGVLFQCFSVYSVVIFLARTTECSERNTLASVYSVVVFLTGTTEFPFSFFPCIPWLSFLQAPRKAPNARK